MEKFLTLPPVLSRSCYSLKFAEANKYKRISFLHGLFADIMVKPETHIKALFCCSITFIHFVKFIHSFKIWNIKFLSWTWPTFTPACCCSHYLFIKYKNSVEKSRGQNVHPLMVCFENDMTPLRDFQSKCIWSIQVEMTLLMPVYFGWILQIFTHYLYFHSSIIFLFFPHPCVWFITTEWTAAKSKRN